MALKIKSMVVGQLQTNCWLVADEATNEVLIVDPGDDADYIMRILADEQLTPTMIVATHGHFDHILAVGELRLAFGIPFLIHEKDRFLVERMRETTKHFVGFDPGPEPAIDGSLTAGQLIPVGSTSLKVFETPGHTPGSVCLFDRAEQLMIVGDLIFPQGGVGRTDFVYSNSTQLATSIDWVLGQPADTRLLSGHGEMTTVENERQFHKQNDDILTTDY